MSLNPLFAFLVSSYPFQKGKGRVCAFAMRHVHGPSITVDDFGNRLLLDLDNYIDSRVYLEGGYEQDNLKNLLTLAERFECLDFVDVGANIGIYSVTLAGSNTIERVFSFEPDAENISRLMANVALNRRQDKIRSFQMALSHTAGKARFFVSRAKRGFDCNKYNTGTNSLGFNPDRHSDQVEVEMTRGDEVLPFSSRRILIKIDTEGHELSVLQGLTALLTNNECLLQVEAFENRRADVNRLLATLGYQHRADLQVSADDHMYANFACSNAAVSVAALNR
jgi:FkbM family methyltransferase